MTTAREVLEFLTSKGVRPSLTPMYAIALVMERFGVSTGEASALIKTTV